MSSGKMWALALLCAGAVVTGCGQQQPAFVPGQAGTAIDLPSTEPHPGTAVVVLIHTGGKVEIHFIAFDTKAAHFGFLKDVNGQVVEAANAKQLLEELSKVYEKRIFVEATEPIAPY